MSSAFHEYFQIVLFLLNETVVFYNTHPNSKTIILTFSIAYFEGYGEYQSSCYLIVNSDCAIMKRHGIFYN